MAAATAGPVRRAAVDQQQRRDVADAALDRRQPDQLGVELVEQRLHAGGFEHRPRRRRSTGGAEVHGAGRAFHDQ
jgi:hypothetical protein